MNQQDKATAPILRIDAVSKSYHKTLAVREVSLEVPAGEFLALVGPSGCGKTTLLKMIGGFEQPSAGRIFINGQDMTNVPPADRPTSMVFQRLALFPHKTVAENIGFPLKLRKVPAEALRKRVAEMCSLMHLSLDYLPRFPRQLSGGEQQRVALARSMVSEPSLLLLDEPLSALDFKLKKNLQAELKRLHRDLGVTFVHVTHDLEEAMILADRICVMRNGRFLQIGKPADIYYRPIDDFVAQFIGETNLFPVTVERAGAALRYRSDIIEDSDPRIDARCSAPALSGGAAHLMVRPELVRFLAEGEPADCAVKAKIDEVFVKGSVVQYRASAATHTHSLIIEKPGTLDLPVDVGNTVRVGWNRGDIFVFPAPSAAA